MPGNCDLESLTEPSHLAIGCALRYCLEHALRPMRLNGWKIDFEYHRLLLMIEGWAQRGLESSVDHFDECVELISASSQQPERALPSLTKLGKPTDQDYLVALAGVVRLLAKPSDDLELLSWFMSGSLWDSSCDYYRCLDRLRHETHDYCFFNAAWRSDWKRAVDAFESVTRPAVELVQWLGTKPPREFDEPMI